MTEYVYDAAKDCDFEITELKVVDDFEGVMEVLQEEDFHKFRLRFNPNNLSRHTVDEIRAMLRHEVIHPITMQESSKIAVTDSTPEIQELQAAIQTAYDEMINYKEYSKRFPNDAALTSAKQKIYTNFSLIFLGMKNMLETGQIQPNHPTLFVSALSIYEDAVYDFFEDTERLEQWVNENTAQALYEFLKWIHEDFNIIQENISNRDDMRKIIFLTFKMMVTVSIDSIYSSNTIEFNNMWTTAYEHCQNHYDDELGKQLLTLWKQRFDKSPKNF